MRSDQGGYLRRSPTSCYEAFDPSLSFIVRNDDEVGRWERQHVKDDAVYMVVPKSVTIGDKSGIRTTNGRREVSK